MTTGWGAGTAGLVLASCCECWVLAEQVALVAARQVSSVGIGWVHLLHMGWSACGMSAMLALV